MNGKLTHKQIKYMEYYKVQARGLLDKAVISPNRIDTMISLEESLISLGKYHFFASKLNVSLDRDYRDLVDRYLELKHRLAA